MKGKASTQARRLKSERFEVRLRPEDKVLSEPRDQEAFAAALLQPPLPGRRLEAAARRYRSMSRP